ncbi:MAG: thioredoxin domain-containing protein, partial [Cyanobacteria bacterium J06555_3]
SELLDSLAQALGKLFTVRYGQPEAEVEIFPPAKNNQEAKTKAWQGRIPPVTDTKAIAAWNALMISGLARAYAVFREQSYLDLATGAVQFILQNQWLDGRLQRLNYDGIATVSAQSEDYALLIKALLDLQAACPEDPQWLEKAIAVQEEFDDLLWSIEQGGYYNNSTDAGKELLVRE